MLIFEKCHRILLFAEHRMFFFDFLKIEIWELFYKIMTWQRDFYWLSFFPCPMMVFCGTGLGGSLWSPDLRPGSPVA